MDGLIFIIMAIVFVFLDTKEEDTCVNAKADNTELKEDVQRVSKLNEDYFDDPNAFSIVINNLGFPRRGD